MDGRKRLLVSIYLVYLTLGWSLQSKDRAITQSEVYFYLCITYRTLGWSLQSKDRANTHSEVHSVSSRAGRTSARRPRAITLDETVLPSM